MQAFQINYLYCIAMFHTIVENNITSFSQNDGALSTYKHTNITETSCSNKLIKAKRYLARPTDTMFFTSAYSRNFLNYSSSHRLS